MTRPYRKRMQGLRSGIYKITCVENGHYYVGRCRDFTKRRHEHLVALRGQRHSNPRLQKCFNKYGEASIKFELSERHPDGPSLVTLEQVYIDQHLGKRACMNINPSSKGCNVPYTEERRGLQREWAKRTEAHRVMHTSEARRKSVASRRGRTVPAETRRRISEAQKGRTFTDEHKEKLRASNSGKRHSRYGKKGADCPTSRAVIQIDRDTKRVIAYHPSIVMAGESLSKGPATIGKVVRGELQSAYGFEWMYASSRL